MVNSITDDRMHPNHWFNRASDLRASAHVLWLTMESKDIQKAMGYGGGFSLGVACYPVYHMLCGLSLELILKAVIVQKGLTSPNTHNLNQLASEAGAKAEGGRKELLKFYTSAILWTGRYPVPVNCDDKKLLDYWELVKNVLSDPVESTGILDMRRNNDADSWVNFNAMFKEYMELFEFVR
ncbi:HEPN domain-containing protein [Phytobacter sp. V91]|uniref:HEPN domain-containing protein n=1 Tax=Phytobacter sp. V91 TaxID=3369425 RepID=UPI003F5E06B0